MSLNTASLLGRYTIHQANYPENKKESSLTQVIDKAFKKNELRLKKAADSVLSRNDSNSEKLINIAEGAQQNLITARTVFPFVLFPDTITIDRQKLTIVHRAFFRTASTISVQIDDVQIVKVDVGPFFGSVHLASKYFTDSLHTINFLRRSDAISIQRLLQGYMIAQHRKIDCSNIDNDQLIILLNDLGEASAS